MMWGFPFRHRGTPSHHPAIERWDLLNKTIQRAIGGTPVSGNLHLKSSGFVNRKWMNMDDTGISQERGEKSQRTYTKMEIKVAVGNTWLSMRIHVTSCNYVYMYVYIYTHDVYGNHSHQL